MTEIMRKLNIKNVGIAGDWHGNTWWAETVIKDMNKYLTGEKIIFQLGDFGYWPGKSGAYFRVALQNLLEDLDITLFFIDGNHENHPLLRREAERIGVLDQPVPVPISDNLVWLQRGNRAKISGKEWLFLGGAASVDRQYRTVGQSWFPEERITDEQVNLAIKGGPADVLVCHDSPAFVRITFPHSNWPEQDLALSQVNREKLEKVVIETGVEYVMNGHMHMAFEQATQYRDYSGEFLDVRVNQFNCDGVPGNWGILDTQTMEWVSGG